MKFNLYHFLVYPKDGRARLKSMTSETSPDRDSARINGFANRPTERIAVGTERCRCGARIPAGSRCFEFDELHESLIGLLRGEVFCSLLCVRAYALEAMEVLHASAASSLLRDYREAYSLLHEVVVSAENDLLSFTATE